MKNWWKNRKRRVAEEKLFAAFATYERFAQGLASTSDVDVAVRLCSEARDIYVTLGDRGREARAWNVHGGLHRCNRRWPEAIASEQRAFEIAMSLEPTSESVGQGLNNLADLSREAYLPERSSTRRHWTSLFSLQYAVQACEHFRRYHPTSRWFGMSMYHLGAFWASSVISMPRPTQSRWLSKDLQLLAILSARPMCGITRGS